MDDIISSWAVPVSIDKPGRTVEVHQYEDGRVTLNIEGSGHVSDPWTWLTPEEAKQIGDALAAATAE